MRLARVLAVIAMIATLVLLPSDGVRSQEKKDKTGESRGNSRPAGKT